MIRSKLLRLLNGIQRRAAAGTGRLGSWPELARALTAQGLPPSTPRPLQADPVTAGSRGTQVLNDPDEVDRLVRLTFEALLRREPDPDTLSAYHEGFANGSTLQDLIADVLESEEYTLVKQRLARRQAVPNHSPEASSGQDGAEDLETLVARLTTCLAEKGCKLPFGAVAEPNRGSVADSERRRRSLRVTLSVLDRL